MNQQDIRVRIEQNLRANRITPQDLRIQSHPYGGWMIYVIAEQFAGHSPLSRRQMALRGLDPEDIEWADLLTPDEARWAAPPPTTANEVQLPLWPQALARGQLQHENEETDITFASDLEDDLPPPVVVTFYSYRGGVGRTTALAHVARILAARGHTVICIDMDLEAPSLSTILGSPVPSDTGKDIVHLLQALEQGELVELPRFLQPVEGIDNLYVIPGGIPSPDYARRLRLLDPTAWYTEDDDRNPLRLLIERLGNDLRFTPDVVLIDARTGISEISAPLLFDLSDLAVLVFFPNEVSRLGTRVLVDAILASRNRRRLDRSQRALTPDVRFVVGPLPATRIAEVHDRYRNRALEWVAQWMRPVNMQRREGREPVLEGDITHFVPYSEQLATMESLREAYVPVLYEQVSDWVERLIPSWEPASGSAAKDIPGTLKKQILRELTFPSGIAEAERDADFAAGFVETELTKRASDEAVLVVLGRKGSGKTALFRRIVAGPRGIPVHAPDRLKEPWMLDSAGFRSAERVLHRYSADWSVFWLLYTSVAVSRYLDKITGQGERYGDFPHPTTREGVLAMLEGCLRDDMGAPSLGEWFLRLDRRLTEPVVAVFDGLDTGFGLEQGWEKRRIEALNGLMQSVLEWEARLSNVRFKVLLRTDLWRRLTFSNKSHYYGRFVTLDWNDRASFFKVVLKQALRSPNFRELLKSHAEFGPVVDVPVEDWSEERLFAAWAVLVGERMKGGKTAFTRNWVWNRLADANGARAPRYLLQLLREVTEWERTEEVSSPYPKSVLRPRGFIESLGRVSEQAVEAIQEEYPELGGLLKQLEAVGRTPLLAEELESVNEGMVVLAQEAGILGAYEVSEGGRVIRYFVPEIYRVGLSMRRPGQA